jgi:hypothetical protein
MWTKAVRRQILSGGNVTYELRKLADRIAQENPQRYPSGQPHPGGR